MTRESLVFLLGFVVTVTPFLGIPGNWKQIIFVTAGLIVAVVGYQLRRAAFFRSIETPSGERHSDAFVENDASGETNSAEKNEISHV